jgi:CSLREA domain-containing protein
VYTARNGANRRAKGTIAIVTDAGNWQRRLSSVVLALLLIGGLLVAPLPLTTPTAEAATLSVTTTADSNDGTCDSHCSLREAIAAATATVTPDTINVPAGTYELTLGTPIQISHGGPGDDLEVIGDGVGSTVVDGLGATGVFRVTSGTTQLKGMTITGGTAADGGGISISAGAELTVVDASIEFNTATTGNGGGVFNNGHLTIENTVVANNGAPAAFPNGSGGGVYTANFSVIVDSTIGPNNTAGSRGGGVFGVGETDINASLVVGNAAPDGAGVYGAGPDIVNSTITQNLASASGGGVYLLPEFSAYIDSATIVGNSAGNGGGIFRPLFAAAEGTIINTIIADNTAVSDDPDCTFDGGSAFEAASFNLVGDGGADGSSCGIADGVDSNQVGSDLASIDPTLAPLGAYGGPTHSMVPLAGSPAIDQGDTLLSDDQRSFARPVDKPGVANAASGADIGAVESQIEPSIELDLFSASDSTPPAGASSVPVADIPPSALTNPTGPAATSTQIGNIESAALNSTALNSTALNSTALNSTALNSTDLDDNTLDSILLSDVAIAGGWEDLLALSPALAGRPIQSITLLDALQDPAVSAALGPFSISDLGLADTPLASMPFFAIGMGNISIKDIGSGAGASSDPQVNNLTSWCAELTPAVCAQLGVNPADPSSADFVTLLTLVLAGSPVNSSALNSTALNSTVLNSTALNSTPITESALNSTALNSTPINSVALNSTALNSVALNSTALNSTALNSTVLNSVALNSTALNSTALNSTVLNSVALNSTALNSTALNSTVLNSVALNSTALNSTALNSTALNSVALNSTVLNSTALNSVPAATLATILDCSSVDCSATSPLTFGDITPDQVLAGATYADLLLAVFNNGGLTGETYASILGDLADQNLLGSTTYAAVLGELLDLGLLPVVTYAEIITQLALADLLDFTNYGEVLAQLVELGLLGTETLAQIYAELLGPPDLLAGANLSLADVFEGLIAGVDLSWQDLDLGVANLQSLDAGGGAVVYTTAFTVTDGSGAESVTVVITLPMGFLLDPDPANRPQLAVPGAAPAVAEPDNVDGQELTWNLSGIPDGTTTLTIPALASVQLGPGAASATVVAAGLGSAAAAQNITVQEVFEPNDTFADATAAIADTIYLTHLSSSTDRDLFKLSGLPVGTEITGVLGNLDADYDLVLYQPLPTLLRGLPERSVPAVDDEGLDILGVVESSAEGVGDVDLLDLDLGGGPEPELAVHTISAHRGTRSERIATAATRVAGDYYFHVTGYNGAASSLPYSFRIKVRLPGGLPPCNTPALTGGTPGASSPVPAGVNTLFLVNRQRLEAAYGTTAADAVMTAVGNVAGAAELGVRGAIIAVDDPANAAVAGAYSTWNAAPCSVDAANRVASAIADLVDQHRSAYPSIENVVIVGADEQIPQFRVPDEVYLSNEHTYASEVGDLSDPLGAALDASMLFTDDPYGDPTPLEANGRHIFITEVALGRLVERPADIVQSLDNFTTYNGLLDPATTSSAFITGYDFLLDGALAVSDELDDTVPPRPTSGLITDVWNNSDLLASWLTGDHTITSVNAHFDHNRLQPASESSGLGSVADVIASGPDTLRRAIVFSMGCHSGLSVSDIQIGGATSPPAPGPGDPQRDWVQTFAEQGAVYAANTGYGYGDTEAVALSELLMTHFADNLNGSMTVGQALQFAKHRYAAGALLYGSFDDKVLMEATFYGLPFYAIGADAPPVPPPDPLPTGTDGATGLTVGSFSDTLVPGTDLTINSTPRGTYYSVDGKTQVTPLRPIQPRVEIDATQPGGLVAHGAMITDLQSFDQTTDPIAPGLPFDPVISIATVDLSAHEPEPGVIGSFPSSLLAINRFQTKAGLRDSLVLVPGQFRSTGLDVGVQRLFTQLSGLVFYSGPTETDFAPPIIHSVAGTGVPGGITFDVEVTDSANGVGRVYVLFKGPASPTWTGLDLAPAEAGRWSGTATGASGLNDYFVQAVDLAGNVAVSSNKADLFTTAGAPPPSTIIEVFGPKNGDWFDGVATVRLLLDPGIAATINIDGDGFVPYTGETDVFGDGAHQVIVLTSDGRLQAATFLIDGGAPIVSSPIQGATFFAGQVVPYAYTCTDAGSGVASCSGPLVGTTFVATASGSFDVVATDNVGKVTQQEISYTVVANPPIAIINEDEGTVDEGSTLSFTASVANATSPSYQWAVLFNGGLVTTDTDPTLSFVAPDDGAYRIELVVVDDATGLRSDPAVETFTASNVAPTISLSGDPAVAVGAAYVLGLGTAIDPGADNVVSITVNWGDGVVETFDNSAPKTHTFITSGHRIIRVSLMDEDGSYPEVASLAVEVLALPPIPPATTPAVGVGLVDIDQGIWHLRNDDGVVTTFGFGNPGDRPVPGDWDGDGITTPGLYRQSDGFFYSRNANSNGIAHATCLAGDPGDIPIAGDWDNDGDDNLGLYRPSEQKFYLFTTSCVGSPMGQAQISLTFGNPSDEPLAGDWDGDGIDEIGLHRQSTGRFYWRNTLDTGVASGTIIFGDPGDRMLAGDFGTVDGSDTPAVFRPGNDTFYFRHSLTEGIADSQFVWPGAGDGWWPVAGTFGLD